MSIERGARRDRGPMLAGACASGKSIASLQSVGGRFQERVHAAGGDGERPQVESGRTKTRAHRDRMDRTRTVFMCLLHVDIELLFSCNFISRCFFPSTGIGFHTCAMGSRLHCKRLSEPSSPQPSSLVCTISYSSFSSALRLLLTLRSLFILISFPSVEYCTELHLFLIACARGWMRSRGVIFLTQLLRLHAPFSPHMTIIYSFSLFPLSSRPFF